jgi:hypothetical protein
MCCFAGPAKQQPEEGNMVFYRTTRLKSGPALVFLGILLTVKPGPCRCQAELNRNHYETIKDVSVPILQPQAEVKGDASKAQGKSALILSQPSSANAVILWNNAAIEAARDSNSGPLVLMRALAMMHTAMFDAWAEYDTAARPTLGVILRRPESERTTENKEAAVSSAAYRVLADLFSSSTAKLDRLLTTLRYDPKPVPQSNANPAAIGIRAATELLNYRRHDGASQLGDLHPGAYSDYTGYSANAPEVIRDPDRWQPLNDDQEGTSITQAFYMPQWGRVTPFGFESVLDVRPQATPKTLRNDPAGYIMQAKDLVELTDNLTERQKVIAEYWELSEGSGTNVILWNQFAQFVSRRDHHELDDDVKLFFALDIAMFDASIAGWDAKRYWDSERPQTAIATLARIFHGYMFHDDWQPYLPTPPFPDFVSSHSVLSAAAAEVLKRFSGSDEFTGSYRRPAGVSGMKGKPGPVHQVLLSWATFTEAPDESGMSRRYGGIHFEDADVEGRALGRRIGALSWKKAQGYISGTETKKRLAIRADKETDVAGW